MLTRAYKTNALIKNATHTDKRWRDTTVTTTLADLDSRDVARVVECENIEGLNAL